MTTVITRNSCMTPYQKAKQNYNMKKQSIHKIFEIFSKANPNPKGDLEHTNTYTLLVAVILSAQATDKGVNLATKELFKIIGKPADMVALGEEKLKDYIKTIGLYKNKAKFVVAMSEQLIERHSGIVPNNQKELEALSGVGRKTANVVLNLAFNQPVVAVDTHVLRISNRIGLAKGKTPLAVEKELNEIIPEEYGVKAPTWLILHGRYICKARKPDCENCPINEFCEYYNNL
ncbi:MAG: endonuclease III [Proteobacteria bacterium]|nr:endonuclease III [Pseudomonadota bacterium]